MAAAFLRVLTACLIAGCALLAASPILRAQDDTPAAPAAGSDSGGSGSAQGDDGGSAAADQTGGGGNADEQAGGGDEETAPPAPEGVLRPRPQSAEQERLWKESRAPDDPFLYTPGPLGPAPGVPKFYNPQDFVDPQISPGLSRYIIQDASGQVVGYLTMAVKLEDNPELGRTVVATLYYDDEQPREVQLWLDPVTLQPLRLRSQQRLVPGAASPPRQPGTAAAAGGGAVGDSAVAGADQPAPGVPGQIATLQRIPQDRVDYIFDSVKLWHSSGGVTIARTIRQLPFSYELQSLPVLVRQVRPYGQEWPFEAALVDGLQARNLPLILMQPVMADVLSAEPAMHQCYELHLNTGAEEEVYWVERSLPRRLIKFTKGGRTYNLFEYSEGK
jgi:hypothetical protein